MPACAARSADPASSGPPAAVRESDRSRLAAYSPFDSGPVRVKICGIGSESDIGAAARSGARYVGFVFYPPSPRSLGIEHAARLSFAVPDGIERVALFVDPDNAALDAVLDRVPVDHVQLHGSELPARGAEIRRRTGKPVIKAVRFRDTEGLAAIREAEGWADQILCDALPLADEEALPGGNGIPFDWRLIQGRVWTRPWLLAGGLTPENVGAAIRLTGARQVDVSSGIEGSPGRKDPKRIEAFLREAGAGLQVPRGSSQ